MAKRHRALGLLTTCAALTLATAAIATAAWADPPERVGRVRHVEGDVSFTPPGEQDWTDVERNYPVTSGEGYWTGDDGRLELQVGGISARLDNLTELDVVDLDYGRTRLALAQGSVDLRVWRAPRGGVVIETPAGEVRIDQPGVYRLDVASPPDDGSYPPVQLTVFEGSGLAPGGYGPMEIDAGQSAMLYAGYDPELQEAEDAAIDDWARDREARERWSERVDSEDTAITGYDDLAAYGDFADDPNYGQVWYPRSVPAGWAPYRDGHWAYVQPWGWTWIDDQPWGFAPFHYGRWAQIGGRWAWVRGAPSREPVYAPALVAFVGGASWRVGLSIGGGPAGGGGAVGWVPLAPNEVYRPSYQVSQSYARQVNITNVRNTTVINNITLNNGPPPSQLRNATAATVVRTETFAHGGAVQHAAIAVPPQVLASAPAAGPAPIAAPDRAARLGGLKPTAGGPGRAPGTATGAPAVPHAPPPRLGAIRSALRQPTAPQPQGGPAHPPPIAGLHAPSPHGGPPPRRPGPALIAPSQVRNPQAQNQHPVTPGAATGSGGGAPTPPHPRQTGPNGQGNGPPASEHHAPPEQPANGQAPPWHPQGLGRPPVNPPTTTPPPGSQGGPTGAPTGQRPHRPPPTPSSEFPPTGGAPRNQTAAPPSAPAPERRVMPPEPPRHTPPHPPAPHPTAVPPKPPQAPTAARPRGDANPGEKPHGDKDQRDKGQGDRGKGDRGKGDGGKDDGAAKPEKPDKPPS